MAKICTQMRLKCDGNILLPFPAISNQAKSRDKHSFHELRKTRGKEKARACSLAAFSISLRWVLFLHLLSEVQNRLSSQDCCEWQIRIWIWQNVICHGWFIPLSPESFSALTLLEEESSQGVLHPTLGPDAVFLEAHLGERMGGENSHQCD